MRLFIFLIAQMSLGQVRIQQFCLSVRQDSRAVLFDRGMATGQEGKLRPVTLRLNNDLVSYSARAEGLIHIR